MDVALAVISRGAVSADSAHIRLTSPFVVQAAEAFNYWMKRVQQQWHVQRDFYVLAQAVMLSLLSR